MLHANNKGKDQPAHPCSLISAFVTRFKLSMIDKLASYIISKFSVELVSVSEQAGLSMTWLETQRQNSLQRDSYELNMQEKPFMAMRETKAKFS